MLWVCPVCAMGPPQNASNVRRICYGSAMRVKRMCNVCPMDVRWMRLGWVHYGCASIVSWMWHVMCYACVCDGGATGVPWVHYVCAMGSPWASSTAQLASTWLGWLGVARYSDYVGLVRVAVEDVPLQDMWKSRTWKYRSYRVRSYTVRMQFHARLQFFIYLCVYLFPGR